MFLKSIMLLVYHDKTDAPDAHDTHDALQSSNASEDMMHMMHLVHLMHPMDSNHLILLNTRCTWTPEPLMTQCEIL